MPLTPVLFTGEQRGRIYLFFDWDSVSRKIDAFPRSVCATTGVGEK